MPSISFLASAATATANEYIVRDIRGEGQLYCTKYGSAAISLQARDPAAEASGWLPAWTATGTEIKLTRAGMAADCRFVSDYEYRAYTTTVGAEVRLSIYTAKSDLEA